MLVIRVLASWEVQLLLVAGKVLSTSPITSALVSNSRTLAGKHAIVSYHIVDLKWQNRLEVGTDKPIS